MINDLYSRLVASAAAIGWGAHEEEKFASKRFRGREDDAQVQLPTDVRGLYLGRYPVLVTAIDMTDSDGMRAQLRAIHNQMVIARSFMLAEEIIDAHILLVAHAPSAEADWRQLVDLVERDETVCRKVVWVPALTDQDGSYHAFVDRTFLAQPWTSSAEQRDAPLDQNERLVEDILLKNGLSKAAAARWVSLADSGSDDPDVLVDQLVAAMDSAE